MSFRLTTTVNTQAAEKMLRLLDPATQFACDQTARDIRQAAIPYARKDTESMVISIYVQTPHDSDYGDRVSSASAVNPDAQFEPEGQTPAANSAAVDVAVKHGMYNEFGTSKMAAQPFMGPAARDCRRNPRQHFQAYLRNGGEP